MLFPPARGCQQVPTNGAASRLRAPVCLQGDRSCPASQPPAPPQLPLVQH